MTPDFAVADRLTTHSYSPPPTWAAAPDAPDVRAHDGRAGELGAWLCALQSFSRLQNHPLSEAEREQIMARDFAGEVRVARSVLLRCARLALEVPQEHSASHGAAARTATAGAGDTWPHEGPFHSGPPALHDVLKSAWEEADSLLKGGGVSLREWTAFARRLNESVGAAPAARVLMRDARRSRAFLQPELSALAERLSTDDLSADVLAVFSSLALLLGRLRHVGGLLRRDQPLKQTLALFALVHEETRELLELIDSRAARVGEHSPAGFEALDSTAYAARMELRKCFAHELCGLAALREPPALYSRIETAHGLLRDCFQQSAVALAQVFDPALDGARLFEAFRTRLEQSLALRRDTWVLLELVRGAERDPERRGLPALRERLESFREGSMRFLMYKDWETFERFADELAAARGGAETGHTLHRFHAYLETLFGQINMRAVLAEHPFDRASAVADAGTG